MDRRGPRALGFAIALSALGGAALAVGGPIVLRAERWLAPDADKLAFLTRQPVECLALPADPQARLSVEIGRAAFRSPTLLGGQAARSGVACETCHRNGRTNRDFHFPGVSGPPGTADVTSSLFSTHRGDDVFNPKPIPDLGGPKAGLRIDQDRKAAALEPFIHGLVTQEFDGAEPPPAVLMGLADYVRALSPSACPKASETAIRPADLITDARRALDAAEALANQGDRAGADVMVQGARARLFLIDERYADPALAADRARLRETDHALLDLREALRTGAPDALARLARARAGLAPMSAALARHEARSLFDPARLSVALDGRLPRRPS